LQQGGLEHVARRDPRQKPLQALERGDQQRRPRGVLQNEIAQVEDLREFLVQALAHGARLFACELLLAKVEHLLGQQPQNLHVVLANALARLFDRSYHVYERSG